MNADLLERIKKCPNLPSLPAIAVQVLELAQQPDADIAQIAAIITKDPALSGKILKTVNSSFYARSHSVGTISQALVVLGLQSVKTLVLTFSLVSNLSKTTGKGFKHLSYWKRSIYAATAAKVIAAKVNLVQQEEAFLAALLSDIGMLVLESALGTAYNELCLKATNHQELVQAEQASLKTTHAEVGAFLATQWNLPPVLCSPIEYSHNPEGAADPVLRHLAEVVQLAGHCGDIFVDQTAAGPIKIVRELCAQRHQLSEADCDAMLNEIGDRTREIAGLFEITINSQANYEAILEKSRDLLAEQSLQQNFKHEQQASELKAKNQQLEVEAATDGLTGLANRAKLDEVLKQRFDAGAQYMPLTLLMMDLDHFKHVNDTYGHQMGDAVLTAVAAEIKSAARRENDVAARYGGEEFVLVLPNTPRNTAAVIAETIRRAIAAKKVTRGNLSLNVTISIGVATATAGGPLPTPAHLLKAADMAVYAAKHGGRNCVKVFALKTKSAA